MSYQKQVEEIARLREKIAETRERLAVACWRRDRFDERVLEQELYGRELELERAELDLMDMEPEPTGFDARALAAAGDDCPGVSTELRIAEGKPMNADQSIVGLNDIYCLIGSARELKALLEGQSGRKSETVEMVLHDAEVAISRAEKVLATLRNSLP